MSPARTVELLVFATAGLPLAAALVHPTAAPGACVGVALGLGGWAALARRSDGVAAFGLPGPFGRPTAPAAGLVALVVLVEGALLARAYPGLVGLLAGALRQSLVLGSVAAVTASGIGLGIGLVAGHARGLAASAADFVTNTVLSIPQVVLLLALVGAYADLLKPSPFLLMGLIGATGWMGLARRVRDEARLVRDADYITIARVQGLGPAALLLRHVLPNAAWPVVVQAGTTLRGAMVAEATLQFLGYVNDTTPSLGTLLSTSEHRVGAAFVFAACVLAVHLVSDGFTELLRRGADA